MNYLLSTLVAATTNLAPHRVNCFVRLTDTQAACGTYLNSVPVPGENTLETAVVMNMDTLTFEKAIEAASVCWWSLMAVWLVLAFSIKRAKQRETGFERLQHIIPVAIGFWLLFGSNPHWHWLRLGLLPEEPNVWLVGILLTALGVALAIWARLSLGANWSGSVTLKSGHELIRRGLYRWIRHPIYSGILLGMIGTATIRGNLRALLGLLVVWASFYFKARREERFLKQEFGVAFDEHAKHTGMFLPRFS